MKVQAPSHTHTGWLRRRLPGTDANDWQIFWCVLRPASILYYEDEACERPVDRLRIRPDTELILVSQAEGYDSASRLAIERLRRERPCAFALCFECEVDADDVGNTQQQACATVFHDAEDLESLASWQEELEKTLRRIASAQEAIDNQCFIDDCSDYEDDSHQKRSSYDATMECDWTKIGEQSARTPKSRRSTTGCSQYEIDDGSDYENDEVARASSLARWPSADWGITLSVPRRSTSAFQDTDVNEAGAEPSESVVPDPDTEDTY